mmetsp:Transcript_24160/g.27864  ORF Transcript_24160/g.27864 Transcript_24160/m.27864 type:complete len:100 (+) Transcript_24160:1359-1658(+)
MRGRDGFLWTWLEDLSEYMRFGDPDNFSPPLHEWKGEGTIAVPGLSHDESTIILHKDSIRSLQASWLKVEENSRQMKELNMKWNRLRYSWSEEFKIIEN